MKVFITAIAFLFLILLVGITSAQSVQPANTTQLPAQLPTQLPNQLPTQLPTQLPSHWLTQLPTQLPALWPKAQSWPNQWPNQWVVAKRQVLAVRYNENKQTTVIMSGTAIAPRVMGKADVEFKGGRTNIRLEMESFDNPQSLGAFYTTYVLWAVAPEGQAENLMELPIQEKFKIESTTKFQTFGLIITAEPHSRVELPSSVIVAENSLRKGTEGNDYNEQDRV